MTSVAGTSSGGEAETQGSRRGGFGDRELLNELLVASGGHDEAAFARFYQLTSSWIYYLLRRRTGSTAQAEDAMVRVYAAIWQRAASFAAPSQSALAWATTLACDLAGRDCHA
jgi:DNA-directed RNA polymerase specialized sigma24 family protein